MPPEPQRPAWLTLLAFAAIYFLWGATFLAIRVGVREVPPLLFAALRFNTAGLLLYAAMSLKGEQHPTLREWGSVFLLAVLIFVIDYGILFWAEQRVPSGLAAVMMATIPAMMAVAEILFLRTRRFTLPLTLALVLGTAGVAVLVLPSLGLSGPPIDRTSALALLLAAVSWSIASALSRKLPLPRSKMISSAAQMLVGGLLLTLLSASLGEFHAFHPAAVSHQAWWALLYLIVGGSIIGFSAYVWLIHHESPTRVGTYAYVNPLVAVLLGYFAGGEALGLRTALGALLVLLSVVVLTTMSSRRQSA